MAQVQVEGIRKVYGVGGETIEAIREVSFAVRPGEFVTLLGPSGCGKSTLLMVIARAPRPHGRPHRRGRGRAPFRDAGGQRQGPIAQDELAIAGGLHGAPVELMRCRTVDLEVPADAEIVLEGELLLVGWTEAEGRFGEFSHIQGDIHWTGPLPSASRRIGMCSSSLAAAGSTPTPACDPGRWARRGCR